jgi:hypothetical protein
MTRDQAIEYLVFESIFSYEDVGTDPMEFYIETLMETPIDNAWDVDRYAQLNTLFGYDIGYNAMASINEWLYDPDINKMGLDIDIFDITYKDKELLEKCNEALGLNLSFDKWRTEDFNVYQYEF